MLRKFEISAAGVYDYHSLPCQSISFSNEMGTVEDSTFQSLFQSNYTTLAGWNISTDLVVKGGVGYKATIKKSGASIPVVDFPMIERTLSETETLILDFLLEEYSAGVNYSVYVIDDVTKNLLDFDSDVTIKDGGVNIDEHVVWIDYLHGIIGVSPNYTIVGDITISANTLSLSAICYGNELSLNHDANLEDVTTMCDAQDNNGWRVFKYSRQNVSLSLSGFYSDLEMEALKNILRSKERLVIEFNPDGNNENVSRGWFNVVQMQYSGDLIETMSAEFSLHVPHKENSKLENPFSWNIGATSDWNEGVKTIISSLHNRAPLDVRYTFSNGRTIEGRALIGENSFTNNVDDVTRISLALQGTDVLTIT